MPIKASADKLEQELKEFGNPPCFPSGTVVAWLLVYYWFSRGTALGEGKRGGQENQDATKNWRRQEAMGHFGLFAVVLVFSHRQLLVGEWRTGQRNPSVCASNVLARVLSRTLDSRPYVFHL